jgi:hypothetical protein
MRTLSITLACTIFALATIACGGDDDNGGTTPTATIPAASPTPGDPAPAPTATPGDDNIAILHTIVSAVARGDRAALDELVALQSLPCTTAQGAGGPPKCEPGEADGTVVDVLALSSCEGGWVRASQVPATMAQLFDGITSVHSTWRATDRVYPEGGDYAVLLTGMPDPMPGQPRREVVRQLVVTEENIIGVNLGCGATAQELIDAQQLTDLIPGVTGG